MKRMPIGQWDKNKFENADLILFHIRGRVAPIELVREKKSCNYQLCYGDVEWLLNGPVETIGWLSPAAPACKYDEIIYCYEKYKNN